MQLLIRRFRPSDQEVVCRLFSVGICEHIRPCFHNAMTTPLYLSITASLCAAGFLLGSTTAAILFPSVWIGLVYFCCHQLYSTYVREKLNTDMKDISGNYLTRPDDCFWVAEAEVDGRAQVLGMVAVVCNKSGEEKQGELFRMIISPHSRRMGLGFKLAQTVLSFCKDRGFSKVVLETSSTQTAAVALYEKLGFNHVHSHTDTEAPLWVVSLARVTVLKMEKHL